MDIRKTTSLGFLCLSLLCLDVLAEAPPETVITVPSVPVGGTVSLGGTVVPYKEATLSAQLPGRVASISGEEGDSFEKDAVLLTITDDELLAQRRAAFANLANAEASLRNAGVQYSRQWISPYGGQQNQMMGGMDSLMRNFTNPMNSMFGSGAPRVERGADPAGAHNADHGGLAEVDVQPVEREPDEPRHDLGLNAVIEPLQP